MKGGIYCREGTFPFIELLGVNSLSNKMDLKRYFNNFHQDVARIKSFKIEDSRSLPKTNLPEFHILLIIIQTQKHVYSWIELVSEKEQTNKLYCI